MRDFLAAVLSEYDAGVIASPRRLRAFLNDFAPHAHLEVDLIMDAHREGVHDALLASQPRLLTEMDVARLTLRLQQHRGLAADSARWAVESWAFALAQIRELQPPSVTTVVDGESIELTAPRRRSAISLARKAATAPVILRILGLATAAAIVATSVVLGLRSAPTSHKVSAQPSTRVAADGLLLRHPTSWAQARPPTELGLPTQISLRLQQSSPPVGLVAGFVRRSSSGFLPSTFIDKLVGETPVPSVVKLDRTIALQFSGLRLKRVAAELTIYVIPTIRRTALIACYGPQETSTCPSIVATARIAERTLDPRPNPSFARNLHAVLSGFKQRRLQARRELLSAKTSTQQALAARRVADVYSAAAVAVTRLDSPPAVMPAKTAISDALEEGSRTYRTLASSGRLRSSRAYTKATTASRQADRSLSIAVSSLARFGYATGS